MLEFTLPLTIITWGCQNNEKPSTESIYFKMLIRLLLIPIIKSNLICQMRRIKQDTWVFETNVSNLHISHDIKGDANMRSHKLTHTQPHKLKVTVDLTVKCLHSSENIKMFFCSHMMGVPGLSVCLGGGPWPRKGWRPLP